MADKETKKHILTYLKERTLQADWKRPEDFSAPVIAEKLGISRTVVSQYLNEALAEHKVIKVNTRPVYFLWRGVLEESTPGVLLEDIYPSMEDLIQVMSHKTYTSVYSKLIGSGGSLSYNVEQCKAAITYPGNGLPILLLGATGTGKSYLAQLTYEYAVEKGIIEKDKQFVSVNCAEYANNPELFLTNIFGYRKGAYTGADKDRKGLIALADGGLLFLDEVHALSSECQEKLFHFMDKGLYHMVGDNEKWYSSKTHIIMATTENPEVVLLKTLLRRIPIITRISSLVERPLQEKKELLYTLLKQEAKKLGRNIEISNVAYQCILDYKFEGNVGQLVNCIRAFIANAYLDNGTEKENALKVYIHHLPDYILKSNAVHLMEMDEQNMVTLEEIKKELRSEKKLFTFNRDLLQQFQRVIDNGGDMEEFLLIGKIRLEQYMDDLCLEKVGDDNPRDALYLEIVKGVCETVGRKLGITFSNQDILNIGRMICDYIQNGSYCESLIKKYNKTIIAAQEVFQKRDIIQNSRVGIELINDIMGSLGRTLNSLGILDLYIAASCTSQINTRQAIGIVIARGYSTASSLAGNINHILEDHVYEAIDLPSEVSDEVIAQKISEYLTNRRGVKDVILLTDTGDLGNIYERLDNVNNINIGLISEVTVKLAVSIGKAIKKGIPVKNIMEEYSDYVTRHESIYLNYRKKQTAILSVCATGIGTAEKISDLLGRSLSPNVDISVIPYNYESLVNAGKNSPVFDKYHVVFIIGTHDPKVEGYKFIALEDVIEENNISEINALLSTILSQEEVYKFNHNLIKNFSLTNVVGHLTVLNPEKVIDFTENIIKQLQLRTGTALKNKTMVGLYIHICCLIERLITERYAVNYKNLEQFIKENQDFILIVKECFKEMEKYYSVSIPISEIAYLYEYIYRL